MKFFKSKWKHSEDEYWLHFFPRLTNFNLTFESWGYFDSRPVLHFQLTTILGIIALCFGSVPTTILGIALLFIPWGNIYLKIPYDSGKDDDCDNPMYGMYFYGYYGRSRDSFWLWLGLKQCVLHMPWSLDWYRTSYLTDDEKEYWLHSTNKNKLDHLDMPKYPIKYKKYPFKYTLKSGEIQETTATVSVEEREWRRKAWMWSKFGNVINKCIEVTFKDGIGEEAGGWKGGVTACDYKMRPGETILNTLQRMERDRKL